MKRTSWLFCLLLPLLLWGLFVPAGAIGFLDVKPTDWHYEAVSYAARRGIVSGTAPATFRPNESMTRGQFITMLGRMDGAARDFPASSFADVRPESYYAPYVNWAAANELLDVQGAAFRPEAAITREEGAVMLSHYLDYVQLDLATGSTPYFSDDGQIADGAREAVYRLGAAGLLRGNADGSLRPKGPLTRAEGATLLMRLHEPLAQRAIATAKAEGAIFPSAMSLSCAAYYLNAGESAQIEVSLSPASTTERTVYFTSGNATILTVSATGRVTAVGAGSSYVEVSTPTGARHTISFTVRGGSAGTTNHVMDLAAFDARYEEALSREIIRLVGIERQKAGQSAIQYAAYLQPGASLRADEMKIMGSSKHIRPDGSASKTAFAGVVPEPLRMAECGVTSYLYKRSFSAAEMTPEFVAADAVQAWLSSREHKDVLLWPNGSTVDAACGFALDWQNYRYFVSYNPYLGDR